MATFTWTPDFGAKVAVKPRVRAISFGDGYEQRQAIGINTGGEDWDLTFNRRSNDEALAIMDFLDARNAVEAFDWTPPNEASTIRVVCREWTKTLERFNLNTISAQFIRVYEP